MKTTARVVLIAISAIGLSACSKSSGGGGGTPTPPAPLETTIRNGPARISTSRDATFWFEGTSAASFRCRVDTGAAAACTSPAAFSGLADGAHTFEVTGYDAAGQADATPATYAWTIDTTRPVVAVTSGPPAFTPDPNVVVTFTVTEAGTEVSCSLDHAQASRCTSPWRATALADGPHELVISALDTAGNADASPAVVSFTVDTTGPAVSVFIAPATPTSPVTVTFSTAEPATFRCALDGAAPTTCTSPLSLPALSSGSHTLAVTAIDRAGNVSSPPIEAPFTVDRRARSTTIAQGPASITASFDATFWFTGIFAESFRCRLDGGAAAPCTSPTSYTGLANGAHAFEVAGVDAAGQPDVAPATYAWTVDTTRPEVTVTAAPPAFTPDPVATVAFTLSEAAAQASCSLDHASPAPCTSPWSAGPLADGAHVLAISAVDAAGNVDASPAVVSFTVDTRRPQTVVDDAPTSPAPSSVTVKFHADETATFRCALDAGAAVDCTSPYSASSLSNAAHQLTIAATDPAGNVQASPTLVTFTVDARARNTTIAQGPASITASRDATFWFTAISATSFRCRLDQGTAAPCTSPKSYTGLADGAHAFEVAGLDAGGQPDVAPATYAWTVDATRPVVAVTAAPPAFTPDPVASVAFTVSEAAAAVSCSLDHAAPAPCTSPWSAGPLADGAHVLAISAVDAAGNTDAAPAVVSFTIDTQRPHTVVDLSPSSPAPASVVVTFHADEAATFRCAVDGGAAVACTSPYSLSSLSNAAHQLAITATDLAGNVEASPTIVAFTVDGRTPNTTFSSGVPSGVVTVRTATFSFAADVASSTFRCALDGGAIAGPCTSPLALAGLADGAHQLAITAVSPAGLVDPTPATTSWTVDATPPDTSFTQTPAEVGSATTASFAFTASEGGGTFLCALDTDAPAGCTSPVDLSALSAGIHTFRVTAVDAAGNADPTPATFYWTIQAAAAFDTSITGGPANPSRETAVAISFSGVNAASFECVLDGAVTAPCTSPYQATSLAEGEHTFTVAAVTAGGTPDATPATWTWTIDVTAPTAAFASGPAAGGWSTTSAATFGFTTSDPVGSTFECALDGASLAPCASTFTTPALVDGAHRIDLRAVDTAGNASPVVSRSWTTDTVRPDATLLSSTVNAAAGTASFDVALSETGTVAWNLDTVPASVLCQATPSTPSRYTVACAGLVDGNHTLDVTATDLAGNADASPLSLHFSIDLAPVLTFSEAPAVLTSVADARFVFTVSKPATVTCALDAGAATPCTSPKTFPGLSDGAHTLNATATTAGGVAGQASRSWTVDTLAPDTTLGTVPALTSSRTAVLALSASEPGVTYRCTLDGASAACAGPAASLTGLGDGAHTFTAAAVDGAGNVDPTPASRTWTVDGTAPAEPTFAVTSAEDHLLVTWTAAADAAYVQVLVAEDVALSGAHLANATASPLRVDAGAPMSLAIAPCHDYWVTVVAVDAAGNRSTQPAPQHVYTTPPVPTDVVVAGRDGVVTLSPASGTHGYRVSYGPASDGTGGTDAAEGPSPVDLADGGALHGFAAEAVRWVRVANRFSDTCVSEYGPAQRAAAYPWIALNARPAHGTLAAVACPAGGPACVAVGAYGEAIGTSDGTTWTRRNGGTGTSFSHVVMTTGDIGFAVAGGDVFRTTDGGLTWLRRGTPGSATAAASRVAFASATVGYAPTASGLYATTDGGATWTLSLAGSWLDVHAFADGQHAVAVGPAGAVRTTANAGTSWTAHAAGTATLVAVTCPSATRCITAGVGGQAYVSDDGGGTWTPAATGVGKDVAALAFADAARGWALDSDGTLHRTENAGASWSPQVNSTIAGAISITATGASAAWVVGPNGLLARSTDGGATWTPVGDRQVVAGPGAIDVLGATTVLVAGTTTTYRSGDGGATWTASGYPAGSRRAPAQLAFANAAFGLMPSLDATDANNLLRTVNGGASWGYAGVAPFSPSDVNDVSCLPDDPATAPAPTCFAATSNALYRTEDGGATWSRLRALPYSSFGNYVRFLDASRGFVASEGSLYVTADGGISWSQVAVTGSGGLEVVRPSTLIWGSLASFDADAGLNFAPMPLYGAAVGAGLTLGYSYAVGGYLACTLAADFADCRPFSFPAGLSVADLTIFDADTWYVVDEAGVVWKTSTAGR